MGRENSTCCCPYAWLALVLLATGPSLASAQAWSGNGPFPPGTDSRTVLALTIDAATGTVYAGTGSGTVFAFGDASLSQVPEASDDSTVTNPGVAIAVDVLANDSDPEGALDTGSIELQGNPVDGAATVNGDGTVTYTPDTGFVGTDGFSYTMRDQAGNESNEAFVNVRVNAPPTAADDTANVRQSEPVTIDVLANDADSDGSLDPATVAMWNSPANGGTIVESDGRITYTSGPDFSGNDSFTYRVGDNDGGVSNEATVVVSVSEAPNIPPIAMDDAATTGEGAPVTIEVLANDSDEDGTPEPATVAVQTSPDNGSTTVHADGTITYTPGAGFTGTDNFTYAVEDDDGDSSNAATVTVTVLLAGGDNSPPSAVDDAATTEEDAPVTIEVLANDSDDDGTLEPATVAVQTSPDNGSAAVNADGTITYTPDGGFTGADTFTYTVQDDDSEVSNAATVTITVNAVIDPPPTPPSAPPDGGSGGGGGGATGLLFLAALTLALVRRQVHCGRRFHTRASSLDDTALAERALGPLRIRVVSRCESQIRAPAI